MIEKANKFLAVLLFLSACFVAKAQKDTVYHTTQVADSTVICARLLHENVQEKNYALSAEYVHYLDNTVDSLGEQTLRDCTEYYLGQEKYGECVAFINNRLINKKDSNYLFLYSVRGVCYYKLNDMRQALKHLRYYEERARKENIEPDNDVMGFYACTLYNNFQYKQAEQVFEDFFSKIQDREELNRDVLYLSPRKNFYGEMLYKYAYNCLFQGKENEGLTLLDYASRCGSEKAEKDYRTLSSSPGFGKPTSFSYNTIDEFETYIGKYPKDSTLNNCANAKAFWAYARKTDKEYEKFSKAMNKSKPPKTLRKALNNLNEGKSMVDGKLTKFNPYPIGEREIYLDSAICGGESFLKELRIYPAKYENAFATPYGEIYLTDAIVSMVHGNNTMLLGICAHEATHFLCEHSLIGLWKQAKKERNNAIWASVAVVANTAVNVAIAANNDNYDPAFVDVTNMVNNLIFVGFQLDAYYFQFKYSRSQEIQSDIMAYRYCEAMGMGGYSYITALQLLGDKSVYMKADKEDDHPTMAFRVGLLKYLYESEHGTKAQQENEQEEI